MFFFAFLLLEDATRFKDERIFLIFLVALAEIRIVATSFLSTLFVIEDVIVMLAVKVL